MDKKELLCKWIKYHIEKDLLEDDKNEPTDEQASAGAESNENINS